MLLDRDDTLIADCGGQVKFRIDKVNFKLVEKLLKISKFANFALITNQAYIEKRKITHQQLIEFHQSMINSLKKLGLNITVVAYCPHATDNTGRILCHCRKPKNAMLENVIKIFGIDRVSAFFIGNAETDRVAAESSNIKYFDIHIFNDSIDVQNLISSSSLKEK